MNKLQAHFKKMQRMAERYLLPGPYVTTQLISGAVLEYNNDDQRARAFASDMVYMLDGPEQRAAEAELDQEREDLRILVRSLMEDLRVVDHVVTLNKGLPEQRVIVASKLMS